MNKSVMLEEDNMLKKYWRRFNTILFLVAFFAPWLPSCGNNTLNGFQSTLVVGSAIVGFVSNPGNLNVEENQYLWFVPIVFVGLICTLLYWLMNLVPSSGSTTRVFSRWRIGMLIGGTLGMLLGSIVHTTFYGMDLQDYLWGYWLTWVGLLSSIGLEINEYPASTARVSDE